MNECQRSFDSILISYVSLDKKKFDSKSSWIFHILFGRKLPMVDHSFLIKCFVATCWKSKERKKKIHINTLSTESFNSIFQVFFFSIKERWSKQCSLKNDLEVDKKEKNSFENSHFTFHKSINIKKNEMHFKCSHDVYR